MIVDPCQSEAGREMKGGEERGGCTGGRAKAEMEERKSNRNRKSRKQDLKKRKTPWLVLISPMILRHGKQD
jgi:hypothetical protein